MAKIEKIKKGTETIYPATIPQAVVDPATEKTVRKELDERANHGYESNPKSLKEVDDEKADHGYAVEETPKTLKEVDTLATQNAEDISQLAGEVSLLDAVQGAKIKDIENVLSTANIGQSAKISVSGTSPLSLPKNAANSGMSVKLEGLTEDVDGVITNFEPTGRIRVEDASENEMSRFYLTAPELRSNGTVKDEIRKGANGYEMVKRVGVGTLGANGIAGGDFEGGLIGNILNNIAANVVSFGTWSENTALPISGTKDGRLVVNQAGTSNIRPALTFTNQRVNGEWRLLSFNYKVNSGTCILTSINIGSAAPLTQNLTLSGTGKYSLWFKVNGSIEFALYFDGRNLFDLQIDALSEQKLNIPDGEPLPTSLFSTIGSNTHYTLATQQIIPISYGGILNSAENGTVYHEPVIADAGVYGTNLPIFNPDYPIASIEEIIKHEGGVDTYLNVATAVIAPDGLSFTHPDLASGDLVLFTYAFDKESTNGNITATFYDSNIVKIDTVTGKAYKIEDVITNGVLTRTLTEV